MDTTPYLKTSGLCGFTSQSMVSNGFTSPPPSSTMSPALSNVVSVPTTLLSVLETTDTIKEMKEVELPDLPPNPSPVLSSPSPSVSPPTDPGSKQQPDPSSCLSPQQQESIRAISNLARPGPVPSSHAPPCPCWSHYKVGWTHKVFDGISFNPVVESSYIPHCSSPLHIFRQAETRWG